MFQKGHPGYKKLGTKHVATIKKEQRRAIFDARISEKWEKIIDKLSPQYIADQFIGKPAERIEHLGDITIKVDLYEK